MEKFSTSNKEIRGSFSSSNVGGNGNTLSSSSSSATGPPSPAASPLSKEANRKDSATTWGVGSDLFDPDALNSKLPKTISEIAKDKTLGGIPLEEYSVDMLRARLLQRHGSMLAAFRQFDTDDSKDVSAEEFEIRLPSVLGVEEVPEELIEACFDVFDSDLSGLIDLKEFCGDKLVSDMGLTDDLDSRFQNYLLKGQDAKQAMKGTKNMF